MKIWFVSIFENTPLDDNKNTRYNSLVNEAMRRSHEVIFWTSTFRHNVKKQRYEAFQEEQLTEHLKINFVPAKAYSKNISFGRLYSHFNLSKEMIRQFEKESEMPNLILVAFPPISTTFEIIKWAEKKNIPVVVDIIDPWPDFFIVHLRGLLRTMATIGIYPMRKKVDFIFKHASAIASISKQYLDWAKTYNPSLVHTTCFYPAVQFKEMQTQLDKAASKVKKNKDILTVIYAGSLGFSYDIPTILKAAALLEEQYGNVIQFNVAGEGPQKPLIEAYLLNHSNLNYLGRLPKEQLMEEYYKADIGLTQHIKGATQSVTYKLFDLLGSGLPIMNSLESEMKTLILDNHVGFHNAPGDAQQLVENIIQCHKDRPLLAEMKKRALELTAAKGDSEVVYKEALDYIESIK